MADVDRKLLADGLADLARQFSGLAHRRDVSGEKRYAELKEAKQDHLSLVVDTIADLICQRDAALAEVAEKHEHIVSLREQLGAAHSQLDALRCTPGPATQVMLRLASGARPRAMPRIVLANPRRIMATVAEIDAFLDEWPTQTDPPTEERKP